MSIAKNVWEGEGTQYWSHVKFHLLASLTGNKLSNNSLLIICLQSIVLNGTIILKEDKRGLSYLVSPF